MINHALTILNILTYNYSLASDISSAGCCASTTQIPNITTARTITYGNSDQRPTYCARLPASQGKRAAPMLPRLARKPIAVGTIREETSVGINALVVGQIGPRLKPVRKSPKAVTTGIGTSQTSNSPTITLTRHNCIMRLLPILTATCPNSKRPSDSPNQ